MSTLHVSLGPRWFSTKHYFNLVFLDKSFHFHHFLCFLKLYLAYFVSRPIARISYKLCCATGQFVSGALQQAPYYYYYYYY